MSEITIYQVKPHQVPPGEDLHVFLRNCIQRQFEGKDYYIAKEIVEEKATYYSPSPRKLRGFLVSEAGTSGHAIYFDVTELQSNPADWLSIR